MITERTPLFGCQNDATCTFWTAKEMSRKSENSRAGSAGDADSVFSSYDSSPRKPADCGSTGPFGDHSAPTKPSSFVIYKIEADRSSSNSEDDESSDLKREYLQKLKQIREKLATIDIANKHYYNNCFRYPPQPFSQCVITEITDEDFDSVNATAAPRPDHFEYTSDGRKKETMSHIITNRQQYKDQETNVPNNNEHADQDRVKPEGEELTLPLSENHPKDSKEEVKTILNYGSFSNTESSTTEIMDLNYNPPKKKPCIRENTPKLVLSEGALPLPYHVRVGLHHDVSHATRSPKIDVDNNGEICHHHIFPDVHVECTRNQTGASSSTSGKIGVVDGDERSCRKSPEKDNVYVLFLDTQEQSSSGSPKSNKTVVTETTITIDTPPHQPKRRKLFLRSANNKIKPIDKISLWEEIRTMDAINKKKRQERSSSKDSYFQRIILDGIEPEPEIDLKAVGSLDVPPKVHSTPRFPSITKITKLCTSVFKKKSSSSSSTRSPGRHTQGDYVETVPTVANELLNFKREQDVVCLDDAYTPSAEEYSDPEDDIDAYYQPHCLFCFCF